MKMPSCGCLLIAGALAAFPVLAAAPPAQAAPRETRPLFALPKQFRMPWSQPAKPARRTRQAAPKAPRPAAPAAAAARRPAPAAAAETPPLPRSAPEPKTGGVAAAAPAPAVETMRPEPRRPATPPAETDAPATAPPPPAAQTREPAPAPDDAAASAGRASDFAGLRPAPPPDAAPLAPLPSKPLPEEPPLRGPIARGVPLPPVKSPAADVPAAPAQETAVAMIPRAPLDGPPLPGPPDADTPPPVVAPAPAARSADPDCAKLVHEGVAISKPLPPLLGPASCGAPLPVELTGVKLADGTVVAIEPAAILRCETARAVATYVRDDLAPAAAKSGPALAQVKTAASYVCRGRNNRAFAKMSEHGLANALDISGFGFKDGKDFSVYDKALPQAFSDVVKSAACARFATVLGPGSDGFHEDHLHLDLRKRRNARSKLCRWSDS